MWICLNLRQAGDNGNDWLESPYQHKRMLRYTKQEDSPPTCLPKSWSWTAVAANSAGFFSLLLLTGQHRETKSSGSVTQQQPLVPGEGKMHTQHVKPKVIFIVNKLQKDQNYICWLLLPSPAWAWLSLSDLCSLFTPSPNSWGALALNLQEPISSKPQALLTVSQRLLEMLENYCYYQLCWKYASFSFL